MSLEKFKTKKGIRFVLAVGLIFAIALLIVGRATFGGVVQDYDGLYGDWSASIVILQGARVLVYSIVFTLLCSIPLGFILLDSDAREPK